MASNVIRVCRKFDFDERIVDVYTGLCDHLSLLPAPWGLKNVDIIPLKERLGWIINGVSYRLRGEAKRLGIGFASRKYRRDSDVVPRLEDYIIVEFNSAKKEINLRYVFDQVIPLYISSFSAFFAAVEDLDMLAKKDEKFWQLSDEERNHILSQTKPRREGLLHIWQVNYWAREQCANYFGLTPEEVVDALSSHVARADVLEDGAYIVVSYAPMSPDEVERITPTLMPLLRK